ncbi:MAG: redoxin family protein [Planctomycetota bacterium]
MNTPCPKVSRSTTRGPRHPAGARCLLGSPLLSVAILVSAMLAGCQSIQDFASAWGSGAPRQRGALRDGLQTGGWTFYYPSGQLKASGPFLDDVRIGHWVQYYENGNKQWEGDYDENGGRTGWWTLYHEDGEVRGRGRFANDLEEGVWTFLGPGGVLTAEGCYVAAMREGPWRVREGGYVASGCYMSGEQVARWSFVDRAGREATRDFPAPPGVFAVLESWPDQPKLRRAGLRRNGTPSGVWMSWHASGGLRFACRIEDGTPVGPWEARDAAGATVAAGEMAANGEARVQRWRGRDVPDATVEALPAVPALQATSAWMSAGQLVAQQPLRLAAVALAELRAPMARTTTAAAPDLASAQVVAGGSGEAPAEPAQPPAESPDRRPQAAALDAPTQQSTGALAAPRRNHSGGARPALAAAPPPVLLQKIARDPAPPPPPQPELTVREAREFEDWKAKFRDDTPLPKSVRMDRYRSLRRSGRTRPGVSNMPELEGKPLPVEELVAVDGGMVRLRDFRGRKTLIVILRGYFGQVCAYCMAQTAALADYSDRLRELNVNVLVVYPGEARDFDAFREAYQQVCGEAVPPYRVFYDPGLKVVDSLGLAGGRKAYPTSIVLDERGVVRYAYKGRDKVDRPAAKKLAEIIENLGT